MTDYLKLFNNLNEFENSENKLIKNHLIDDVELREDPYRGHAYVDLGLPSGTKWATMNIGASAETNFGKFYQYGMGAAEYPETSGGSRYSGVEDPLAASADTAVQLWGGPWHMPTKTEMEELTANTTFQWANNYKGSGNNGALFTAQNGNSIFFPACGYFYGGTPYDSNRLGYYFGSTPKPGDNDFVYCIYFHSTFKKVDDYTRECGFPIRPVAI